jgi:bifunctional non-homologous end joining protein LigD
MSVRARVLYPEIGFTTDDLVETYTELAPVLLPHLQGRPLTLKRFPDSVGGESFWEKDSPGFTPKWAKRFAVPRKAGGEPIQYLGMPDLKTLRWAALNGCVEIHAFLHKYPYIHSPTLIAFDLDPGQGVNVIDCCEVAVRVRAWFREYGLESFPKVSGSRGIQVYVPLNTPASYQLTQPLARAVAQELEKDDPKHIISRMIRAERRGKVFIDWSQNSEHKTTVSVYSLRAKRAEPFVSMPLTWEEVESAFRVRRPEPLDFGPEAAIERVRRLGDLFAGVLSLEQRIPDDLRSKLRLPPPVPPSPVRVPKPANVMYSLPRSSSQGGRKLFVIHLVGKNYELGIQRDSAFQLFGVRKIPMCARSSSEARDSGSAPLQYLTEESGSAGTVWDLGTYEVVKGSLEKGEVAIYLSGRKLAGQWVLRHEADRWKLMNVSAKLKREIPVNGSALVGICRMPPRSGIAA